MKGGDEHIRKHNVRHDKAPGDKSSPLVLYLTGARQFYGASPLAQKDLAEIADLDVRTVRRYENARSLPSELAIALKLALALHLPFERLIAPHVLNRMIDEIGARRRAYATRKNEGRKT